MKFQLSKLMLVAIISFITVVALVYVFHIRPSNIVKRCNQEASGTLGLAGHIKYSDQEEKGIYESNFVKCLRKNGIK